MFRQRIYFYFLPFLLHNYTYIFFNKYACVCTLCTHGFIYIYIYIKNLSYFHLAHKQKASHTSLPSLFSLSSLPLCRWNDGSMLVKVWNFSICEESFWRKRKEKREDMELEKRIVVNGGMKLPIGYRFHPTEQELILHYLLRKAFASPLPSSIIPVYDVFFSHPLTFPGLSLFLSLSIP